MLREATATPIQRKTGEELGFVGKEDGLRGRGDRTARRANRTAGKGIERRDSLVPPAVQSSEVRSCSKAEPPGAIPQRADTEDSGSRQARRMQIHLSQCSLEPCANC